MASSGKYNCKNGRIIIDSELIDNQRLRIRVSDNGDGLTEEDISKLFTSFERLDKVISVEGVGIGLVITKYLIELMGGAIGVYSTPGEGSTFWIDVNLAWESGIDKAFSDPCLRILSLKF